MGGRCKHSCCASLASCAALGRSHPANEQAFRCAPHDTIGPPECGSAGGFSRCGAKACWQQIPHRPQQRRSRLRNRPTQTPQERHLHHVCVDGPGVTVHLLTIRQRLMVPRGVNLWWGPFVVASTSSSLFFFISRRDTQPCSCPSRYHTPHTVSNTLRHASCIVAYQ